MRFGYSCHDSFPSPDTNTQQIFWTVLEVTRLGAAVDLHIPSLNVPGGEHQREVVAAYYGVSDRSIPSGLAILPLGDRPATHPLGKGWFDWRIPRYLSANHYDLIWTRDPLAAAASLHRGLPVVFETYRPDFASARRFGAWRRACLGHPGLRGVITHSRVAADAFMAAGVAEERCLVAHNGFAPSLMQPALNRAEARAELGLPQHEQLVVYTGHVGPEKGIDALIRTAAGVPGARMVIVGGDASSAEADRIETLARNVGAKNLLLRRRVPVADVSTYLYAADCLIVPPTDEPLRGGRTVLPMKIFGYLAAGRPILAPRLPDVEEVLTDGKTACLVTPQDFGEAAAALRRLLGDSTLQTDLARNALAKAAEYTWEARARRVLDFLCQVRAPITAHPARVARQRQPAPGRISTG